MWWRRWLATQLVTEPSNAIEPAAARMNFSGRFGCEAAVGEQAVEPDADAEAGDEVEDRGEHEVVQVDGVAPQQRDRDRQRRPPGPSRTAR